jgi:hypothetical protein
MEQDASAFDMAQESNAKACPVRGPFDETRNVGDHEAAEGGNLYHPQVRRERRKGIRGNLGARGRKGCKER